MFEKYLKKKEFKKRIDEISTKEYRKYKFREPKDGYLIYKKQLKPKVRKYLVFILKTLGWIIDRRNENKEINKKILAEIGLPEDTPINDLDAYYKKEFRRKKYTYSINPKLCKDLEEPTQFYFDFYPNNVKKKSKNASLEFLKTFVQD